MEAKVFGGGNVLRGFTAINVGERNAKFVLDYLRMERMRITAEDLKELGCIDGIVPEPEGGAHVNHEAAALLLDAALQKHLSELKKGTVKELLDSRYTKFRNMAQFLRVEE